MENKEKFDASGESMTGESSITCECLEEVPNSQPVILKCIKLDRELDKTKLSTKLENVPDSEINKAITNAFADLKFLRKNIETILLKLYAAIRGDSSTVVFDLDKCPRLRAIAWAYTGVYSKDADTLIRLLSTLHFLLDVLCYRGEKLPPVVKSTIGAVLDNYDLVLKIQDAVAGEVQEHQRVVDSFIKFLRSTVSDHLGYVVVDHDLSRFAEVFSKKIESCNKVRKCAQQLIACDAEAENIIIYALEFLRSASNLSHDDYDKIPGMIPRKIQKNWRPGWEGFAHTFGESIEDYIINCMKIILDGKFQHLDEVIEARKLIIKNVLLLLELHAQLQEIPEPASCKNLLSCNAVRSLKVRLEIFESNMSKNLRRKVHEAEKKEVFVERTSWCSCNAKAPNKNYPSLHGIPLNEGTIEGVDESMLNDPDFFADTHKILAEYIRDLIDEEDMAEDVAAESADKFTYADDESPEEACQGEKDTRETLCMQTADFPENLFNKKDMWNSIEEAARAKVKTDEDDNEAKAKAKALEAEAKARIAADFAAEIESMFNKATEDEDSDDSWMSI